MYAGGTTMCTTAVRIPLSANMDMRDWDTNSGYYSTDLFQNIGLGFGNTMVGARSLIAHGKEYQRVT